MPTGRGPTFLWPLWGWNMIFQEYSNTMFVGEIFPQVWYDDIRWILIFVRIRKSKKFPHRVVVFYKIIHPYIEEKYYFTWPTKAYFHNFFFASPPFRPVRRWRRLSEIAIKVDEKIAESNRVVTPYFLIEMQTLT